MPTLTFTEGDIAEIYVHNELDEVRHCIGMDCIYLIKRMECLSNANADSTQHNSQIYFPYHSKRDALVS
jgi:hypothetical protein